MTNSNYLAAIHIKGSRGSGRRAVFLDRDGVVNVDNGYVGTWDRFEFAPGAIEAIKVLNALGYRVIIVTNQSGIARGYYTQGAFSEVTARMLDELAIHGARIEAVYACPHHANPGEPKCSCRKPAPGMILAGIATYGLSAEDSILIGDKPSDIKAARTAGIGHCVLVSSDPDSSDASAAEADVVVPSLAAFAHTEEDRTAAAEDDGQA